MDLSWNSENPELTPCFEKTILVWIPCGFLWIFSIFDVFNSSTSKSATSSVPWSPLNLSKIGMTLVLASLQLIFLLLARGIIPDGNLNLMSNSTGGEGGIGYPVDVYDPAI